MILPLPLLLVTGVAIFFLLRTGHQRLWPGIVCALFGFSLASTDIGHGTTRALTAVSDWLTTL